MPFHIKHIDKIAREKKRDVLFLEFHPRHEHCYELAFSDPPYDYVLDKNRSGIISWLNEHQIKWESCAEYANENLITSYMGQIYIDVPYDEKDSQYCSLRGFLENPDGSIRINGIRFNLLTFEHAMKNIDFDLPGFRHGWL